MTNNNNDHSKSPKKNIRKTLFWLAGLLTLVLLFSLFSLMSKVNKIEDKVQKQNKKEQAEKAQDENNANDESNDTEGDGKKEGDDNESKSDDKDDDDKTEGSTVEKMTVKIPKLNNGGNISFAEYDVDKSSKVLNATLKKLFALRSTNGNWNNLQFSEATLNNKKATIKLTGGGTSLSEKQKKEITAAATQFSTIDNVEVMINNNVVLGNQNTGGNGAGQSAIQSSNWTPCTGLFQYTGNQGNSTFMDIEAAALAYTSGSPSAVTNNYKVRGCISQIGLGTYDSWGPFEGMVGSYKIKQGSNVIASGGLVGHKMPGSTASELNAAAIAGEDIWFEESTVIDTSALVGQSGTIEIHNDNASGESQNDRLKIYSIIFQ